MDIEIKKMQTDEEKKGKAFVHWRSWHTAYPGLVNREYLDNLTLEKCEEIAFKWPDNILVAKNKEQVIGFIGYGKSKENTNTGEIFALYVLPEYCGKGIGSKLMQSGLDLLRMYPQVYVWLLKENKKAFRFYQKCGFMPDGKEKMSESVGAAGIRMTLYR